MLEVTVEISIKDLDTNDLFLMKIGTSCEDDDDTKVEEAIKSLTAGIMQSVK